MVVVVSYYYRTSGVLPCTCTAPPSAKVHVSKKRNVYTRVTRVLMGNSINKISFTRVRDRQLASRKDPQVVCVQCGVQFVCVCRCVYHVRVSIIYGVSVCWMSETRKYRKCKTLHNQANLIQYRCIIRPKGVIRPPIDSSYISGIYYLWATAQKY